MSFRFLFAELRCVEKFAEIITIEGKGSSDWW